MCYIGLDVHKRVIEACALDERGEVLWRRRFELNGAELSAFVGKLQATDRVALEATTNCWAVARAIKPHVAEVVVSNPLATKAIAQAKVKTDKVDALVLAQLLRCDYLPRVWEPDEATQALRELCGRRAGLVRDRTGIRNRVHALLAVRLIAAPEGELFGRAGLAWLRSVALDAQGRLLLDVDLRLLEGLDRELAGLDGELARRGYGDQRVKLLMTLPGVDVAVAETLLAALGDVNRFPDGAHAASYLGLVPSTRASADKCYHGPITKRGNSQARWMMVQAAQHLGANAGPLGFFFRKLARRKNRNVAVVATARKLVMIAWQMLKENQPYRYAVPTSTQTKLARLRIRATGEIRRGGSPKGTKSVAGLTGGSRRVKSLAEVYQQEGLPVPAEETAGEQRALAEAQATEYVAELKRSHRVPRKSRSTTETQTGASLKNEA